MNVAMAGLTIKTMKFNHRIYVILLFIIVYLSNVHNSKRYDNNRNNGNENKLHFITEPESVWASADGRRITFKCLVSPSEAQIKWLLNGTILNDGSYEWIKMSENKLSIKLQKSFDVSEIIREQRSHHENHNLNLQGAVFQCLAELNEQVIVSQPAKLIIAELNPFEDIDDKNITAISGNNVVIPCELPHSIPLAVAEFEVNNNTINSNNINQDRYRILPSGRLLIINAKPHDSGSYRCIANNPFLQEKMFANHVVNLKVIKPKHASSDLKKLKFILQPKQQITAILGSNITLECVANSFPLPKITWSKINGELPKSRTFIDNGNIIITTVQKEDEGIYSCNAFNSKMNLDLNTELKIYEMPQIVNDDYEVIEMEKGQNYELHCNAKGQPKPLISWLHNGYFIDSQITNEVIFEEDGSVVKIFNSNPQSHSGIFQCFATNELGTTYIIKVIQFKSASDLMDTNKFIESSKKDHFSVNSDDNFDQTEFNEHNYNAFNNEEIKLNNNLGKKKKNKELKLIPPSKPEVSKLNDDSVMVRWHVPKSTGLPIIFFKVQYKELGKGDWNTVDVDISPHIFSYPVCCLNPNSTYRFRIAAVYSNDDNKNGKSSSKFVFQKDPLIKKPIHSPTILNASSLSPYEIMVEWEFLNIETQSVDGFFINYRATDSAGQYLMVTALGANTRAQNISFLQPNTAYEVKMQCFNEAGTSDFSNIYTVKTMALITDKESDIVTKMPPTKDITKPFINDEKMQLIAIVVVSITTVLVIISCVIICCVRQKTIQVKPKIKKEKTLKSPSDYYFTSISNYDRRLSNGQLNTISGTGNLSNQNNDEEPDGNSINIQINHNDMPSSLNRRNSFRNSLSYSSHHLYSSNNNIKNVSENHIENTATIDRKRSLKNSIPGSYLDRCPSNHKINHHSTSFTRLNGTLERKRRSRNDLNGIDKAYYSRNNVSSNEIDRQCSNGTNGNSNNYFHQQNGHFVIMQSSC